MQGMEIDQSSHQQFDQSNRRAQLGPPIFLAQTPNPYSGGEQNSSYGSYHQAQALDHAHLQSHPQSEFYHHSASPFGNQIDVDPYSEQYFPPQAYQTPQLQNVHPLGDLQAHYQTPLPINSTYDYVTQALDHGMEGEKEEEIAEYGASKDEWKTLWTSRKAFR
jgi:hypothetical protein